MRLTMLCSGAIALTALTTVAAADFGDQYILPILRTQDGGANGFEQVPGAGFQGSTAIRHVTNPGQEGGGDIARIYWQLDNNDPTNEPRLYRVEWWDPTQGPDQFHVVEEQFRGSAGEVRPVDPAIPWNGAFGTNHMFLNTSTEESGAGVFRPAGPGPQAPESDDPNAGPNGDFMWLRDGSQLYVKWDFAFGVPIDRTYAELRLTEVPEPAGALLMAGGAAGLLLRRRRGA